VAIVQMARPASFTVEINGAPLLNRDDMPVTSGRMPRVMLPICKTCKHQVGAQAAHHE
jgi:hypothetical protein